MLSLHSRRAFLLLMLTVAAFALASCLSAEEHDYVTYDPAKDQFQMLMVLSDIRGKDADDLGYLKAIYDNRDHLIAPVLPGGDNVFPLVPSGFLRLSDKQAAVLGLFSGRPSDVSPIDTGVALASIQIHPGTFFVENKKLGFYQSVTIPGKAIDTALEEASKTLQTDDMAKSIQTEIDRRAGGGKTVTWAQLTADALKQITIAPATPATAAATAPTDDVQPMYALDADSLKALKQALTDKSLRLVRDHQKISVTLPLSARDSAALADLYKAVLAKAQDVVQSTKETPENADELQTDRAALQVSAALAVTAGDKGVTASLDIVAFAKGAVATAGHRVDMNNAKDDAGKDAPDPVKFMQDQKVPLNETLTADQILKDFNAGTLKAYPSDKPVKPGDGIVAPKPQ